jgi:hypothetical protein
MADNVLAIKVKYVTEGPGVIEREAKEAGERAGREFTKGFQDKADTHSIFRSILSGIGGIPGARIPGTAGLVSGLGKGALSGVLTAGGQAGGQGITALGATLGGTGGLAALAAGIVAIPAIAATASAGMVTIFGAGLSAIGIMGALKLKGVREQMTDLGKVWAYTSRQMALPFKGAMIDILASAETTLGKLEPTLKGFSQTVAPAFKTFGTTLMSSFAQPAVMRAIQSVGKAFADLLKAFAPQLPGIIKTIADGINTMATALTTHPQLVKILADVLAFFLKLGGWVLSAIGYLTDFAGWLVVHLPHAWDKFYGWVIAPWIRFFTKDIPKAWDQLYSNVIAPLIRFFTKTIPTAFDLFRQVVKLTWDQIEIDFLRGASFITGVMGKLPGPLGAPFRKAHADIQQTLGKIQQNVSDTQQRIQQDWDKIHGKSVSLSVSGMGTWKAYAAVATRDTRPGGAQEFHAQGWRVPGTGTGDTVPAMLEPGEAVIPRRLVPALAPWLGAHGVPGFAGGGIIPRYHGSVSGAFGPYASHNVSVTESQIVNAIGDQWARQYKAAVNRMYASMQVGNVGGGVQRWAPLVASVLSMEGLSGSLLHNVLYQMQTESNGNPNSINLWDSNAAAGDPSRGLMQVIGSTFSAYHWPGTSYNIYDPEANVAAALNYARSRYGPTLMSGGMGVGSGHGYDAGGWLPPGVSLAVNRTGRPERIIGPGGINITFEVRGGTAFDQFLLNWIKHNVRVVGGGDVQVAFGSN